MKLKNILFYVLFIIVSSLTAQVLEEYPDTPDEDITSSLFSNNIENCVEEFDEINTRKWKTYNAQLKYNYCVNDRKSYIKISDTHLKIYISEAYIIIPHDNKLHKINKKLLKKFNVKARKK